MNEIFVFGSNEAGRHGKGAAKTALEAHGAVYGKGHGHHGNSYAIPTKDAKFQTLPKHVIENYIQTFLHYAYSNPELRFNVTQVGCGLAGYSVKDIAPMFSVVIEYPDSYDNVYLPKAFLLYFDINSEEKMSFDI
jgi:hypothetical protein